MYSINSETNRQIRYKKEIQLYPEEYSPVDKASKTYEYLNLQLTDPEDSKK